MQKRTARSSSATRKKWTLTSLKWKNCDMDPYLPCNNEQTLLLFFKLHNSHPLDVKETWNIYMINGMTEIRTEAIVLIHKVIWRNFQAQMPNTPWVQLLNCLIWCILANSVSLDFWIWWCYTGYTVFWNLTDQAIGCPHFDQLSH